MNLFNRVCAYLCVFLFVCFVGAAGTASAATIDFTSGDWAGSNGQESYTVDGVTATANPLNATLNYSSTDGLGVGFTFLDREPDEINNLEWLSIDLGGEREVQGFTVGNLFTRERLVFSRYDEVGYYSFDFINWTSFTAQNADGTLQVNLDPGVMASTMYFGAEVLSLRHDFTLKSIQVGDLPAVPEPATMTLLGLGLLGAGYTARRRRMNSAA